MEKKEPPNGVRDLQIDHLYFGKPSSNMIAVYPLLNLKGPVLGLSGKKANDSVFFLFTSRYLSRSNWLPIVPVNVESEDWLQLPDFAEFEEEDSDISSLEGDGHEEDINILQEEAIFRGAHPPRL